MFFSYKNKKKNLRVSYMLFLVNAFLAYIRYTAGLQNLSATIEQPVETRNKIGIFLFNNPFFLRKTKTKTK